MDQKNTNVTPSGVAFATSTTSQNTPIPSVQPPIANFVSASQAPKKKHSALRGFFSTFLLIGGALAFAIFINQFIFQSYQVDGSSMEPSLQNSDRLIIWKLPHSWSRITGNQFVPKRGDIVVFHKPDGSDEQLIKRVIGLGGDHVVVSDGSITVYNKENPKGFNPDDAPYGKNLSASAGNVDVQVKTGEIFVSGDNRVPGASLDSRSSLGNIDLDLVVGKLVLRLFPFQSFETF